VADEPSGLSLTPAQETKKKVVPISITYFPFFLSFFTAFPGSQFCKHFVDSRTSFFSICGRINFRKHSKGQNCIRTEAQYLPYLVSALNRFRLLLVMLYSRYRQQILIKGLFHINILLTSFRFWRSRNKIWAQKCAILTDNSYLSPVQYLWLGQDLFLSHPFQYTIH
jgi:hypothetical protein